VEIAYEIGQAFQKITDARLENWSVVPVRGNLHSLCTVPSATRIPGVQLEMHPHVEMKSIQVTKTGRKMC
jgi:hypothetical protein